MIIGIDCSRAFVKEKTGTENYSYQVVKHMLGLPAMHKHKLVLFTRPGVELPAWSSRKGVKWVPIKYRYLWTQLGLAAATWQERLDVLWVPAHTLPVLRRPGLRTVVTIHGLEYQWLPEYQNWLQRWYLPLSTKYAAKAADRLIAVSHFTKDQLEEELRVESEKIAVVWEGVEAEDKSSRVRTGIEETLSVYGLEKERYFLFMGSLQPRKNLPALIRAFAEFARARSEYRLVISGGKGWLTKEIFMAPAKYGVQEKVIFAGRVSEEVKWRLYQGAVGYVQPSWTEGFGLPVLEAMAIGVPVIVSDGGALPEVVDEAGLVVKLGEGFVGKLVAAMERVVREPKLRKRLVVAGKKRVAKLSWERAAAETLKELEILLVRG